MSINVDFNTKVMREIGLEIDEHDRIVDQDTGNVLQVKGKYLTNKNKKLNYREETEFDPLNNNGMMVDLFSYYVDKLNNEDEERYISTFYSPNVKDKKEKNSVVLKDNNKEYRSKEYFNNSIRLFDLILQLNGESDINLDQYDSQK